MSEKISINWKRFFLNIFNFYPPVSDVVLLRISETFLRSLSTFHVKIVPYQVPVLSVVKDKVNPRTGREGPEEE